MLVIDTNIFISAVIFPKNQLGKIIRKALDFHSFALSEATFAELQEVLNREKFDRYLGRHTRLNFLEKTAAKAHWIEMDCIAPVRDCRDAKDNKFLELALASKAEFLITGDLDLLVLDPYCGIRILTAAAFGTLMES